MKFGARDRSAVENMATPSGPNACHVRGSGVAYLIGGERCPRPLTEPNRRSEMGSGFGAFVAAPMGSNWGIATMPKSMFGAAFGAVIAALCLTSAQAVPLLNPADFQVIEGPGQYTVINNSTDWYVYAFAVENPAAADPSIVATTDFHNWNGLSPNPQFDLNTGGPVFAFAYASGDTSFATDPPLLSVVNFGNYIAPGSFSDRFFFNSEVQASNYGLLVVSIVQSETFFDSVNGVAAASATPIPAALPLFATGLGALGLIGWRRKRKVAA